MQIKTAHSFVLGDILTAIMGPEGRLMTWAGRPWATWDTPPGNQEAILTLLRRAVALRRGVGRDFLVFGHMLRPLAVRDIEPVHWICEQQLLSMPTVLHARWQAADGRTAVALANWTEEERLARLEAARELATPRRYHLQHDTLETVELAPTATFPLVLPPLSVALVEYGTA